MTDYPWHHYTQVAVPTTLRLVGSSASRLCTTGVISNMQDQTTTTLSATAGQVGGASIVTIEHFSSLRRLLRVVAWIYCFVRILRFPETRKGEGLLTKDVEKAHNFLICAEQVALCQNTKFRLWRRQFGLFEDKQGVLRCGGRLSNVGIPCETANPIFLEKRSYVTHLIVKDCHERIAWWSW